MHSGFFLEFAKLYLVWYGTIIVLVASFGARGGGGGDSITGVGAMECRIGSWLSSPVSETSQSGKTITKKTPHLYPTPRPTAPRKNILQRAQQNTNKSSLLSSRPPHDCKYSTGIQS